MERRHCITSEQFEETTEVTVEEKIDETRDVILENTEETEEEKRDPTTLLWCDQQSGLICNTVGPEGHDNALFVGRQPGA